MSKTALVILAPGAEDMEFVIAVDVLRRAGVNVTVAGLNGPDPVKCSRDVLVVPDTGLEAAAGNQFDAIVLPGGPGTKNLVESAAVGEVLRTQDAKGGIVAAICAAPTALAAHGIGLGKNITSYPSVQKDIEEKYKYLKDVNVVHDGNIITSRGPGTAFEFALKVAEVLVGEDKAKEVAKAMLLA